MLREQYPAMYHIVQNKSATITEVPGSSPSNVSFRRDFVGPRLTTSNALLGRLAHVQLSQGFDEFYWNLHQSGSFTVDSMYWALVHSDAPVTNKKNGK